MAPYSGYCMYLVVLSFLKHFNGFILLSKEHVKQRIRDTYMYFGASLGVTAGTAVAIFRSPAMMNIVARQGNNPDNLPGFFVYFRFL